LQASDKVIHRVIAITWESAALPSLFTLIAVSVYHVRMVSASGSTEIYVLNHLILLQDSNYHLVRLFVFLTGKLYTIGLLRTLNSRIRLRERLQSHDLGRVSLGA
jgi:hypothetical protein